MSLPRGLLPAALAVFLTAALASCGVVAPWPTRPAVTVTADPATPSPTPTAPTFVAGGRIQLLLAYQWVSDDHRTPEEGDSCHAIGFVSGIRTGTSVVVWSEAGKTIASGRLGEGVATPKAGDGLECEFGFLLPSVPATGGDYGIAIDGFRWTKPYTQTQMQSGLRLTMGSS